MGKFEDAVINAKSVVTTVSKKAGKMVDVSKLRLSAAELNKEIDKRFEALGRVVYDSRKDGTDIDGLVAECEKSIDALYERLDAVNEKIAHIKEKRYCDGCGAVIDRASIYCSRCGRRVEKAD